MTLLTGWPSYTDDSGDGVSGTVIDAALFDSMKSAIETLVHSSTNTGVTPADIIDEVVTARGNLTDLEDRLDGVIDSDGNLITPASIVSSSQLTAEQAATQNFAKNSTFFLWSSGLTSAPDYYTLANGTISITGSGESDTERKIGEKACKVTWSSGTATLTQKLISSGDFGNLDHLKVDTKKVAFGAWVKTSIASHARLQLDDGSTTTETSYHTGDNTWQFLGGVHTMSGAASKLDLVFRVEASGSAYISGVLANFGEATPTIWVPEPIVRGSAMLEISGDLSTGNGKKYVHFARPIRIDNLQALVITVPTGAGINIDFEKNESSWQSMVTAGQIVAAGDRLGNLQTSGNYDRRCLGGMHEASGSTLTDAGPRNKICRLNIDQVGSSVAGSDLFLRLDGVQCLHPLEDQLAYNALGV